MYLRHRLSIVGKWRRLLSGSRLLGLCAVAVGLLFIANAASDFFPAQALTVSNAWARPMDQGMTDAVYLTIENTTDVTEQLTSAASNVADSVELHQTTLSNDMAQMRPVAELDIPPGGSVKIAPEGYHLMLNNLHQNLNEGETFQITLTFASRKQIAVNVSVRNDAPG